MFSREPATPPFAVADLVTLTTAILLELSRAMSEDDVVRARVAPALAGLLKDVVSRLDSLLWQIGRREEAAPLRAMMPDLAAYEADIEAALQA